VVVAPAVGAAERSAEGAAEAAAVRSNKQRAIRLCLVPGLVVGLVVGAVLIAVGLPVLLGVGIFVLVAAGSMVVLWQRAPSAVLRAIGARPSDEWEHPRLHNLVEGLCATMGLPLPTIWVVDSPAPNAMALGRDPTGAALVVTTGLDAMLTLVELEGVLAHELVHIKRYDTVLAGAAVVTSALWATVAGTAVGIGRVHRIIGVGREFDADQRAARVVRFPPGIGTALEVMADADADAPASAWPPGHGRTAALTRWLWIDPMVGVTGESVEGNLDDTRVRAAAQSLL
jgi:Zn-dependent protease with chaperone function